MRIEQSYPSPVQGVSTLPARNRADGQVELQENFRSDPVTKLSGRGGTSFDRRLHTNVGFKVQEHSYYREGAHFRIIFDAQFGKATVYKNDILIADINQSYIQGFENLIVRTLDHKTYVCNADVIPAMDAATDLNDLPKAVHVNITAAVNYGEKITLRLTPAGQPTSVFTEVFYNAPTGGFDEQRATDYVAEQLATAVNTLTSGQFSAVQKGSSLAIWETTYPNDWVHVEISSGQGEASAVVVNDTIESTDGLPLYAVNGSYVKIQPDPTTDKGTYYLQAQATNTNNTITNTPANWYLEEVVWAQTRVADEPYRIDKDTMPHIVEIDPVTNGVTFVSEIWEDRNVGDNRSVKVPKFIGNTIDDINFFQNRLVFLSNNTVEMTKTDDLNDWWKASAIQLLVSDPISIKSSDADVDRIKHMNLHNRELLLTAANKQLKLPSNAITPQTASMVVTTSIPCQTAVPPVLMGNAVYLPISHGDSTGIIEYRAEKDTGQDEGVPISQHITEYMPGHIVELKADHNLNMLVVRTDGTASNEFFVYEQFFNESGEKLQQAWSKWVLSPNVEILNMTFNNSQLKLFVLEAGEYYAMTIQMYEEPDVVNGLVGNKVYNEVVYLDWKTKVTSTDGKAIQLPSYYPIGNPELTVVSGNNSDYPLQIVPHRVNHDIITFDRPLTDGTACEVYVGYPIKKRVIPTRPFIKDDKGIAVTTDRLRINRYYVSVEDTRKLSMKIHSDYSAFEDQNFNSRAVGAINNQAGVLSKSSGDILFSFGHNATHGYPEFYSSDYLNVQITGISWAGQYHKTSRRL